MRSTGGVSTSLGYELQRSNVDPCYSGITLHLGGLRSDINRSKSVQFLIRAYENNFFGTSLSAHEDPLHSFCKMICADVYLAT